MPPSEKEVKEAEVWRLEAESEYRHSRARLTRFWEWLVKNIVAVGLGAVIGILVGAGWNHLVTYEANKDKRAIVLYEAMQRIQGLQRLYGELDDATTPAEARKLLEIHKDYMENQLGPSSFAVDPLLKSVPDQLLVSRFRLAGGDRKTAAFLSKTLSDESVNLKSYSDSTQNAEQSTLVKACGDAMKRLFAAQDTLFLHEDLQRVLPVERELQEEIERSTSNRN